MVHWVMAFVTKLDDLSSMPRTNMVERTSSLKIDAFEMRSH